MAGAGTAVTTPIPYTFYILCRYQLLWGGHLLSSPKNLGGDDIA